MVAPGGHAWLLGGHALLLLGGAWLFPGGMCGCLGGAWFFLGGMHGFFWGGVCGFSQGGMHGFFQGGVHRIRRNTANERAVRILLECILVYKSCAYDKPMEYSMNDKNNSRFIFLLF